MPSRSRLPIFYATCVLVFCAIAQAQAQAQDDEGEQAVDQSESTTDQSVAVDTIFPYQETFGAELASVWEVKNPDPNAYLPEKDGIFVLAAGGEDRPEQAEAANVFTLPTPLPASDFDLSLDVQLDAKSGFDRVYLGFKESEEDLLYASLFVNTKGCGPQLHLRIRNLRPIAGEDKPLRTGFTLDLLDGPFADNICTNGREYGDAVLVALAEDGGTLTLARRGRRLTAAFEMMLPPRNETPAEIGRVETYAVSRTELLGNPFFMLGQAKRARDREGTARFQAFAFQPVAEE